MRAEVSIYNGMIRISSEVRSRSNTRDKKEASGVLFFPLRYDPMLAYTTVSDWFYLPSALEVAVYFFGFILVLAAPYAFVWLVGRLRRGGAGVMRRGGEHS